MELRGGGGPIEEETRDRLDTAKSTRTRQAALSLGFILDKRE